MALTTRKRPAESTSLSWAALAGLPLPSWPNKDWPEEPCRTITLSRLSLRRPSHQCCPTRGSFPTPDTPMTRWILCLKSTSSRQTPNRWTARIQAFLLDPVGPLTYVLEGLARERRHDFGSGSRPSQKLSSSSQLFRLRRTEGSYRPLRPIDRPARGCRALPMYRRS